MSKEDDSSLQFTIEKSAEVTEGPNLNELKTKIECETCKGVFFKQHHFNIHSCKKRSKRKCTICQKTFPSPCRLKEHLYLHSGEKPYECEVCKKRFSQKGYLSKHAVVHKKEKPYKCNHCNKSYSKSESLKEHIYTHTGERPLKCNDCDKSFSNRSSYNTHIAIHGNVKTYECDVCSKRFNQRHHLNRHRNIHATEKPYKCDICGKTFSLKAGLNEHMYYHSGKKPYKCDECDKTFTRRTTLAMHRELHNPESSKLPRCHVCNKRFVNKFVLEWHLVRVHKKFCLICDTSSQICTCTPELDENASLLSSISKKDMFKCQACSEIVSDRSLFMEHVASHPDFVCLDCGGIYANCDCFKPSMEDCETAEDDLKCSLCDKQFFDETHLYDHLLNHNCMICGMSMNNCFCSKDNEDEIMDDKKNDEMIDDCKPLTELKPVNYEWNFSDENARSFIKHEYDYFQNQSVGFGDIGSMEFLEEDLNIKEAFTIDENKPSKIDLELAALDEEFSEVANEIFTNDKNLHLIEIDKNPAIINHEFIGDDNDHTDFKSEYVKLEMKPLELEDLINSDNFIE